VRKYAVTYRSSTGKFDIIAKDDTDEFWFVFAEHLAPDIARAALAGLEAGK
jgi:hypothetical protein